MELMSSLTPDSTATQCLEMITDLLEKGRRAEADIYDQVEIY